MAAARRGGVHRGFQQRPVCRGGEGALEAELVGKVGVRARAEGGHDVHQLEVVGYAAGGAHADDVLHVVLRVQLPGVDADGRDAHAAGLDGDARALPGAGVALDAADVVDKDGAFKEVFRDVPGAQRVAGHQHSAGKIAFGGAVVRGGHRRYLQ